MATGLGPYNKRYIYGRAVAYSIRRCTPGAGDATRIRLGPEIRPEQMKTYIWRIARELNIPVMVRRVPGGLLSWHSVDGDIQQPKELAEHLRAAQRQRRARGRHVRTHASSGDDPYAHDATQCPSHGPVAESRGHCGRDCDPDHFRRRIQCAQKLSRPHHGDRVATANDRLPRRHDFT